MDLVKHFAEIRSAIESDAKSIVDNQSMIRLIDLTQLNEQATTSEIQALGKKAEDCSVAAVCVLPQHLGFLAKQNTVKKATVVNFPGGDIDAKKAFNHTSQIIDQVHIDEIDYVFPYKAYLSGEKQYALRCCLQQYQLCQSNHITFKVIVETGAFPDMQSIYQLSQEIIANGCDFLKTSTGKIATGATLEAAYAILKAIQDSNASCGIKLSGGIKSKQQALQYIHLAQMMQQRLVNNNWFRLGASSLLDDLL